MGISFYPGWWNDHDSARSQDEVQNILEEIPNLILSYDHSAGAVGTAIVMDFTVTVKKGIHDDKRGKHLTIEIPHTGRTWHVYLKRDEFSKDNTFIWRADEIR